MTIQLEYDIPLVISIVCLAYLIYIFIRTSRNIEKLQKDHLLEMTIEELKRQNSVDMEQIEQRLKAKTMIYIDSNFNRLNKGIDIRVKRLIKEE